MWSRISVGAMLLTTACGGSVAGTLETSSAPTGVEAGAVRATVSVERDAGQDDAMGRWGANDQDAETDAQEAASVVTALADADASPSADPLALLCPCNGALIACDAICPYHPIPPVDAGDEASLAPLRDAGTDGDFGHVCRSSFASYLGSLISCPASAGAGITVDLCAAASSATVAMCAGVSDNAQTTQDALACVDACKQQPWRLSSESAACLFDCWYVSVCKPQDPTVPGGCAASATAYGSNVPAGTFSCLAQTCYAQFDPSAF